jgi:anti-sigma factor RsiW
MTCPLPDGDLQAWFDGELEPAQARRVQHHVAGCPACQRCLKLWADLRAALRAQTASSHVPAHLHERTTSHLRQRERRQRLSSTVVAALAAIACLSVLVGVYWRFTSPEPSSILSELVGAHAALARGKLSLTYPSTNAAAIQRWLEERLPFRPFVPRIAEAGFRLLGTRTLVLRGRAAAVISFSRAGHLYSLVSLPALGTILDSGEPVALEGHPVRVVRQEDYTLVLWSVRELVYVMIADDDRDELLEYAALCVQQMSPPTYRSPGQIAPRDSSMPPLFG